MLFSVYCSLCPLASVMGGETQRRGSHFPSLLGLGICSDKKDQLQGRWHQTDHTITLNGGAVSLTHGDLARRHGGPPEF